MKRRISKAKHDIFLRNIPFLISPEKAYPTANLIRKKRLDSAIDILFTVRNKSSFFIYKLLSGVAKTLLKRGENPKDYFLFELRINKGTVLKKVFFRARGNKDIIRRRSSYVYSIIRKIYNGERANKKTFVEKKGEQLLIGQE